MNRDNYKIVNIPYINVLPSGDFFFEIDNKRHFYSANNHNIIGKKKIINFGKKKAMIALYNHYKNIGVFDYIPLVKTPGGYWTWEITTPTGKIKQMSELNLRYEVFEEAIYNLFSYHGVRGLPEL